VRTFVFADYIVDREGELLSQIVSPGIGFDTKYNGFARFELRSERILAGDTVLQRRRLVYTLNAVPSRVLAGVSLEGSIGEEIDFEGARRGHGGRVAASATVRPGDHLQLDLSGEVRWMDLNVPDDGPRRLFTAHFERLKATYTLTARSFVRVIGQYVGARRNPALYEGEVDDESGDFSASALFAYRLNWQSVLFLGYGDARSLSGEGGLPPKDRQLFLKVSYAFQK
jgi:hypothetical protein